MQNDITRIHDELMHPEKETILRLLRKLHDGERLPKELKKSIDDLRYTPCDTNPELPRKRKLSLPSEATPNITVSLDVMSHNVHHRSY